jgi:hypothetical protein
LVVGGDFTHVDGSSQNHIASLAPAGGALQSWSTHTPYAIIALASDSTGVFTAGAGSGGNFAGITQTGSMLWQGGTNGNVQAVAVLDGIVYVGGHYTDYCGPQSGQHTCTNPIARSKLLAVDETTGTLNTTWHPAANSTLGVFAMDGSGGGAGARRRLHQARRRQPAGLRRVRRVTGSPSPPSPQTRNARSVAVP